MILTPIPAENLPALFDRLEASLAGMEPALSIFRRIARGCEIRVIDEARQHAQGVALAGEFGIPVIDEAPQDAFSWDGQAIRTRSEPSVLIHEVAHYQLSAPDRRFLPDFGLGAGPETGRIAQADAAQKIGGVERDIEEGLCSLLGIIWEAELGHPALPAFMEQNWLEGEDRPMNREHFLKMVGLLTDHGFLDGEGRPLYTLRITGDDDFFAPLISRG